MSKKAHREKFRQLAKTAKVDSVLHFITADIDERRNRVMNRNKQKNKTDAFDVTQHMFDFMETWFEAPDDTRLHGCRRYEPKDGRSYEHRDVRS